MMRCKTWSPYQFSGNRPIDMIELEGLEPVKPFNDNAPERKQITQAEAKRLQKLYEKGIVDPGGWRPFEMTDEDKRRQGAGGSQGFYKEKPSIEVVKSDDIEKTKYFDIEYTKKGISKLKKFIKKTGGDITSIEAEARGAGVPASASDYKDAAEKIFKDNDIKVDKVKGKSGIPSSDGAKIVVKVNYKIEGESKTVKTYGEGEKDSGGG